MTASRLAARIAAAVIAIAAALCMAASAAPAAQVIGSVAVGEAPDGVVSDGTHVWVANSHANTVTEIDASNGKVVNAAIKVGKAPAGIASNGTHVWVANSGDNTVSEIEASSGNVIRTLNVGKEPTSVSIRGSEVWVANAGSNNVSEILEYVNEEEEVVAEVIRTIGVGSKPISVDWDGSAVWVANAGSNNVSQIVRYIEINEEEEEILVTEVHTIGVGSTPVALSSDGTDVWVANAGGESVSEISVSSAKVVNTIKVPGFPAGISSDGNHVWVTDALEDEVTELKASSAAVLGTLDVGESPNATYSDGTHVWVANEGEDTVSEIATPSAPSASITSPTAGGSYNQGAVVAASFSCSEGSEGPGLKPGSEGCSGSVGNGSNINTATPGGKQFKVIATSKDGEVTEQVVNYTVTGAPTISINTPGEGASYKQGQIVAASFSCSEGFDGPGLKPGSEGCSGTVASGSNIETATTGEHAFTVKATSKDGLSSEKTVKYRVAVAPSVSIVSPSEGGTYSKGQLVAAEYSCNEGEGGPGLKPGSEGCAGTVANGSNIETSTGGERSFKVIATSKDGQITEKTVKYKVVGGPSVTIIAPLANASYRKGQAVPASYSCKDGEGGPGLKPGSEGCAGPVPNGGNIDTSTGGEHEFKVIATSKDNQVTEKTVKYKVIGGPTVSITTPPEGAIYAKGQVVAASFSCAEGEGGPGLKPGSEGCRGTVENGHAIETSSVREHSFTVTARSKDGQVTQVTVRYKVVAAPVVTVLTPTEGATYKKGAKVAAIFTCREGEGGPGLKPGTEGCAGTVAYGKPIETATVGEHVFTVIATSKDGEVTERIVKYKVRAPLL